MNNPSVCKFFARDGFCRNGNNCAFSHNVQSGSEPQRSRGPPSGPPPNTSRPQSRQQQSQQQYQSEYGASSLQYGNAGAQRQTGMPRQSGGPRSQQGKYQGTSDNSRGSSRGQQQSNDFNQSQYQQGGSYRGQQNSRQPSQAHNGRQSNYGDGNQDSRSHGNGYNDNLGHDGGQQFSRGQQSGRESRQPRHSPQQTQFDGGRQNSRRFQDVGDSQNYDDGGDARRQGQNARFNRRRQGGSPGGSPYQQYDQYADQHQGEAYSSPGRYGNGPAQLQGGRQGGRNGRGPQNDFSSQDSYYSQDSYGDQGYNDQGAYGTTGYQDQRQGRMDQRRQQSGRQNGRGPAPQNDWQGAYQDGFDEYGNQTNAAMRRGRNRDQGQGQYEGDGYYDGYGAQHDPYDRQRPNRRDARQTMPTYPVQPPGRERPWYQRGDGAILSMPMPATRPARPTLRDSPYYSTPTSNAMQVDSHFAESNSEWTSADPSQAEDAANPTSHTPSAERYLPPSSIPLHPDHAPSPLYVNYYSRPEGLNPTQLSLFEADSFNDQLPEEPPPFEQCYAPGELPKQFQPRANA